MIGSIRVSLFRISPSATSSKLVLVESLSRAENILGSNRDIEHLGPRWGPLGNATYEHILHTHL